MEKIRMFAINFTEPHNEMPVFLGGQVVSGVVTIELAEPMKIRCKLIVSSSHSQPCSLISYTHMSLLATRFAATHAGSTCLHVPAEYAGISWWLYNMPAVMCWTGVLFICCRDGNLILAARVPRYIVSTVLPYAPKLSKISKVARPHGPLTRYVNCGLRVRREYRERFPRQRLQRKPLVSHPSMHYATCITHACRDH